MKNIIKKAFVTGADGFLGKALCSLLLEKDIEVFGLSRTKNNNLDKKINWFFGDITKFNEIKEIVSEIKPDWIFHLAADIRRDRDISIFPELYNTNVTGTLNVLESGRENGISAFVFPGSFEEYGDNKTPFKETMAPRPLTPYGITKTTASLIVKGYGLSGFEAAVVRMPIIYGPGQVKKTFVSSACESILGGEPLFLVSPGEQTRDFLFINDASEAFIKIAENAHSLKGEILNVCTGLPLTLREASKIIEAVAKKEFTSIKILPCRENEQMFYYGDSSKIKKLTGWQAKVDFEEGVRRTLFFNKKHL